MLTDTYVHDELQTVELLGLTLTTCRQDSAVAHIIALAGRGLVTVGFVNLHTANLSCTHPEYKEVLNGIDVLFNDGIGVELGWRLLGGRVVSDLPGNVVVPALLRAWPDRPCRVFIVGSTAETVRRAAQCASESYDGVLVVGTNPGFFSRAEEPQLVESINAAGADILLVGMGNPYQEMFLARHRATLKVRAALGVGGLVDIWGGKLIDYPRWATRWRCHWLLRLVQDPVRMWRRYLLGGPVFFARVLRWRWSLRRRTPTGLRP